MNFRHRGRGKSALVAIDITSLMDVVFLLLIFLLVTTVFKTDEHAFVIEFPTSSAQDTVVTADKTTVYVDKNGDLHLLVVDDGNGGAAGAEPNAEKMSPKALREALKALHAKKPDMGVAIKGDKSTSYQAMIEVVGYLQEAGFRSISFPYEFGANSATDRK